MTKPVFDHYLDLLDRGDVLLLEDKGLAKSLHDVWLERHPGRLYDIDVERKADHWLLWTR